jgi:hypothetical protein
MEDSQQKLGAFAESSGGSDQLEANKHLGILWTSITWASLRTVKMPGKSHRF